MGGISPDIDRGLVCASPPVFGEKFPRVGARASCRVMRSHCERTPSRERAPARVMLGPGSRAEPQLDLGQSTGATWCAVHARPRPGAIAWCPPHPVEKSGAVAPIPTRQSDFRAPEMGKSAGILWRWAARTRRWVLLGTTPVAGDGGRDVLLVPGAARFLPHARDRRTLHARAGDTRQRDQREVRGSFRTDRPPRDVRTAVLDTFADAKASTSRGAGRPPVALPVSAPKRRHDLADGGEGGRGGGACCARSIRPRRSPSPGGARPPRSTAR